MDINTWAIKTGLAMAGKIMPPSFPPLTPTALITAARSQPSASATEGLTQLTTAIATSSTLTPFGRLSTRWDLLRLLRNSQFIETTLTQNPTTAAAPITKPIFIIGLPRSGTSFLHDLLTHDPTNLVPRNWQTISPIPRPDNFNPIHNKHARTVNAQLKLFASLAPGFSENHPVTADSPQECSEITAHVFQSLRFDTTYRVPGYLAWLDTHGHTDAFAFHKKFLQVLQAGLGPKRWVLKCPDHTFSLDAILATYPDARFVVVHRNPLAVFASVAHLTEILRTPFISNIDPAEIGRQVTDRWLLGAERLVAFDEKGGVEAGRKINIHYEELVADPVGVVERIYGHFGEAFAAGSRAAMTASLAVKPRGGYSGARNYALGRFGIRPELLAPRFERYLDYFGVVPGGV